MSDEEWQRERLSVPTMDCPSCAGTVTEAVEQLDGVQETVAQPTSRSLEVRYDPERVTTRAIGEQIEAAGHDVGQETQLELAVPEMDCASCAATVTDALETYPAVVTVETRPAAGQVTITHDGTLPPEAAVEALADAGYEATPVEGTERHRPDPVWRTRRAMATGAGAILLAIGAALAVAIPDANALLATIAGREYRLSHLAMIASAAVAGAPIVRNGIASARTSRLDIDVLMTAGILGAVAAHHPFEGAILAVLFSVAELLERYSMDRVRGSIRELMALSPDTATVRREGEEETVPAAAVEPGETVVVRPGERIPLDGEVTEGTSAVDQSPITGESVPVDRSPGDEVYAGTISETGYLEIVATSPASESTIAKVVRLVERAERDRTRREQFVDRFSSVYTPVVVAAAILTMALPPLLVGAAWDTWFLRGLTLLVIACPCALVISTPVSVVSGITSAARNGVLVKTGRTLEALGETDVLAIDKTGTLTTGDLTVTDVVAVDAPDRETVLARAGALEHRSDHPIAVAIRDRANEEAVLTPPVEQVETKPGRGLVGEIAGTTHRLGSPALFPELERGMTDGGQARAAGRSPRELIADLEGEGKTVVVLGTAERLLGVIGIADQPRSEAAWAVERLTEQGVRVVMLTGDNEGTAAAVADQVGIDEYQAELLPEEKLEAIRDLEREYGPVAMVGDGINDAPALATAEVGVAMGAAGTDTALETADIALMSDELSRLPYLYRLSGSATGVIRQNIWSSLAVKAVLAVGAPFGIVTIIHAVVIGDMGMSLAVTGNAMRLSEVDPELPESPDEAAEH